MPLCDRHLSTAFDVGLTVRRLTHARDAIDALLDVYSVEELSFVDANMTSSRGT